MIELSGEYTINDYILANRIHIKHDKSWVLTKAIFAFFLVCMVIGIWAKPHDPVNWIFAVLCLVYINYEHTILPSQTKKYFNEQKQLHGKVTIIFEQGKVSEKTIIGDTTFIWLHHIVITPAMLLLYNTPKTFIVTPRKWFSDNNQFEDAVKMLKDFPTGINDKNVNGMILKNGSIPKSLWAFSIIGMLMGFMYILEMSCPIHCKNTETHIAGIMMFVLSFGLLLKSNFFRKLTIIFCVTNLLLFAALYIFGFFPKVIPGFSTQLASSATLNNIWFIVGIILLTHKNIKDVFTR